MDSHSSVCICNFADFVKSVRENQIVLHSKSTLNYKFLSDLVVSTVEYSSR